MSCRTAVAGRDAVVDQAGAEVLPDRGDPAAEVDIAIAGCFFGLLQGGVDAVGDKRNSVPPAIWNGA